jgi:hypothetical protein
MANIFKETWVRIGRSNGWLKEPCKMHGPTGATFSANSGKCVGCGKRIYWPAPKYRVGDKFRSFYKDWTEYGIIITDITRDEYFYDIYPKSWRKERNHDHATKEKIEEFYKDFVRIGPQELIHKSNEGKRIPR